MGHSDLVGLDIGSHILKLSQFNLKKTPPRLEAMEYVSLPSGTIIDHEIQDKVALEKTLKALFSKTKVGTKNIAFAVSGPSVISKKISLPSISIAELKDQLSVIASQYIPLSQEKLPKEKLNEELNIDFQVLSQEDGLEILLVAVKKKYIESYCSVLEAADLRPVVVETKASALSRLISNLYADSPPLGLLHIGASHSLWVVFQKGLPIMIQDFSFGGNDISETLCSNLKLSFQEAENLKMTSSKEKHLPQGMEAIIQSCFQSLLKDLVPSLSKTPIEKIVISGGTAKINELAHWIFKATTIPTETLKPLEAFSINEKKVSPALAEDLALLYPVSMGLALRRESP